MLVASAITREEDHGYDGIEAPYECEDVTKNTSFGARYGLTQIVRELEHSLTQELDFRLEADSTRSIIFLMVIVVAAVEMVLHGVGIV